MEKGFMEGCEKFPNEVSSVEEKKEAGEQLIAYHENKIKELKNELQQLQLAKSKELLVNYIGKCYRIGDRYRKVLAILLNGDRIYVAYQNIYPSSLIENEVECGLFTSYFDKDTDVNTLLGYPISDDEYQKAMMNYITNVTIRVNLGIETSQERFIKMLCQND